MGFFFWPFFVVYIYIFCLKLHENTYTGQEKKKSPFIYSSRKKASIVAAASSVNKLNKKNAYTQEKRENTCSSFKKSLASQLKQRTSQLQKKREKEKQNKYKRKAILIEKERKKNTQFGTN